MRTHEELLGEAGITFRRGWKFGAKNATTCPQCSPRRKKANRQKPCLTVLRGTP